MEERVRVFIADDEPKVRLGLRVLLERLDKLTVIGEAGEAVGLLEKMIAETPDLVLLDWGLPGLRSAELTPFLKLLCPGVNVIVLSGRPEVDQLALDAGADAFISKADPPEKLVEAIQAVKHMDFNLE